MIRFIFLFVLLFSSQVYANQYIQAKVISVTDGDTLTMQYEDIKFKVRLYCIDAPERGQPYSAKSKDSLTELTLEKEFTLEIKDKDQYGRIVGVLYEPKENGRKHNINLSMIRNGMAFVYPKYCTIFEYYRSEAVAKKNKVGVWQNHKQTKPWEYRKR